MVVSCIFECGRRYYRACCLYAFTPCCLERVAMLLVIMMRGDEEPRYALAVFDVDAWVSARLSSLHMSKFRRRGERLV